MASSVFKSWKGCLTHLGPQELFSDPFCLQHLRKPAWFKCASLEMFILDCILGLGAGWAIQHPTGSGGEKRKEVH